jgi:hypothetical protein
MKSILYIAALCSMMFWLDSGAQGYNYKPTAGYVPNAAVAIKIAIAVWEPIYGEKKIAAEAPYRASLADGVWTVEGTLPKKHMLGGVAIAEIAQEDGRILRVSHGQ